MLFVFYVILTIIWVLLWNIYFDLFFMYASLINLVAKDSDT